MNDMSEANYRNCPVCDSNTVKKLHFINQIDIVRCKNCKMVYADLRNKEIEEKNIYNEQLFYNYLASEPVYTLAYYDNILEKIEKHFNKKQIKILELGCGPGFFMRRAKLKGFDAVGCDFSPYAQTAKEVFDLNIIVKDIFNAGFNNEEFDVVITHATHEHLSNMHEITSKLYETLKTGGLFIISGVPNYNTMAIKLFKNFYRNMPPSHVNFFEKRSLKIFYRNLGIKPIKIKSYGMSVWAWAIMKWMKSRKKNKMVESNQSKQMKINIKDVEIRIKHKVIAKIYEYLCFPGMGRNLEIWGVKK